MSQHFQKIADGFRKRDGTPVVFKGVEYRVTTEEVSGTNAREQGMPRESFGDTAPRVFTFSPRSFVPFTSVAAPTYGDKLTFEGEAYYVTHTPPECLSTDNIVLLIYALRQVEITVSVEREARIGDGAGGKAKIWSTVTGLANLTATQTFYGRTSDLLRQEEAAHGGQGPGVETRKLQLFVFRQKPQPVILTNDRIFKADGKRYSVLSVRAYEGTLQVDTEIVE